MTYLTVDDGVRYMVRIAGSGPPLLLLHGFTGSSDTWTPHLPMFAREHRTIAVDLLGHGDSDAPAAARHAVEQQAADLALILGRLDAAPADVLGYSFGARVGLRLAVDTPAAVRRLVLESPSAGISDTADRERRRHADLRWVEQLERGDMVGFARDWGAQPIFAGQARLATELRALVDRQRRSNRPEGLAASLLGAGQGVMTPMHDLLSGISASTLVMSGRLDPGGTERAAEVAAAIPGAVHEVVADAGHTPHLETPAAFQVLVRHCLATPVASTPAAPVT